MRFLQQQQQLLQEVKSLREDLKKALDSSFSAPNNAVIKLLVRDLNEKERALATAQTDQVLHRVEAEIALRQKAEAEIGALTEQADAYEDILMTLQSENTRLTMKLHVAGLKVDAALLSGSMPTGEDNYSNLGADHTFQQHGIALSGLFVDSFT